MPKLTEDGAPGAPRYPTLGDRLGRCLLWVSDASLLSRVPSSPLSRLVPCTVMGSHLIPLLNFSSSAPSPPSPALEEQALAFGSAQALFLPSLAVILIPLPPPEMFPVSMQAQPRQTSNWLANVLQQLGIPNLMAQEVPNLLLDYYTCPFKVNKLCW